jgi:hypothetical protein
MRERVVKAMKFDIRLLLFFRQHEVSVALALRRERGEDPATGAIRRKSAPVIYLF